MNTEDILTLTCCQDHTYPHRKYMVCMVWNIIQWRWEEVSRMRDDDEQYVKIELLSQWKLEAEFRNNFQHCHTPPIGIKTISELHVGRRTSRWVVWCNLWKFGKSEGQQRVGKCYLEKRGCSVQLISCERSNSCNSGECHMHLSHRINLVRTQAMPKCFKASHRVIWELWIRTLSTQPVSHGLTTGL